MEKTNKPLVSVVIPAYNSELYISQTIQSVVTQTYTNWELIVVDDCSADRTKELVEAWVRRDSRIRLLACPENRGVAEARNAGIAAARGEWIALLDSDDLWVEEKLEKQLDLANSSGAKVIYCSYMLMRPDRETPFLVPEETSFEHMLIKSVISCSTVLLHESIAKHYTFDKSYYHEDYVLWLTILQDGHRAKGCREVLAKYRLLPASRSANKLRSAWKRWIIYRDYLHLPLLRRCWVFVQYALAGVKKYRVILR